MPLKREEKSFISVKDGDIVVLARLQDKQTKKTKSKVWLLGDVPLMRDVLFSPKAKEERTTKLVIFIKSTILMLIELIFNIANNKENKGG